MRRDLSQLAAVVCSLTVACARPPAVDTEAARTALRQADSAYSRAGTSKDRAAVVAMYAPDAVMYPPAEATASGPDAIGKVADAFVKDPAFTAVFKPVSVEVSTDGTMGYTLNMADWTFTGPNGKPVTEHARDFHVWRKQADGSWKLAIDIWNDLPPATPASK